jgi:hypothetical protein
MRLPVRQHWYNGLGSGKETRHRMVGAHEDELILSTSAMEILSIVCGMHLTRTQRQVLLPTLEELLTDTSLLPLGAGPLSQADVLGACIGLAMFALGHPRAAWSFMHIPGGRAKTPDIYAVSSDDDSVWHIELKSVAPLDSEILAGRALDTCGRIATQRRRAVLQLANVSTPTSAGPRIQVVGGLPSQFGIPTDGRGFVITILPAAGLVSRADIRSPAKQGCPTDDDDRHQPCSEH